MNRSSETKLLEDTLRVLVGSFGAKRVQLTLARVVPAAVPPTANPHNGHAREKATVTTKSLLDELEASDPERFAAIGAFADALRDRRVLRESEDLRQFAQIAGLKALKGARAARWFRSRAPLLCSCQRSS